MANAEYIVFPSVFTTTTGTITGLTAGQTYHFVVIARNIVKLSQYSNRITVKAA